jgi:hypothetical protein
VLKVKEKTPLGIASYRKFADSREQLKVKIANEILFLLVAWQLLLTGKVGRSERSCLAQYGATAK